MLDVDFPVVVDPLAEGVGPHAVGGDVAEHESRVPGGEVGEAVEVRDEGVFAAKGAGTATAEDYE